MKLSEMKIVPKVSTTTMQQAASDAYNPPVLFKTIVEAAILAAPRFWPDEDEIRKLMQDEMEKFADFESCDYFDIGFRSAIGVIFAKLNESDR